MNKQTRLLAAVEEAITIKLDADRGYAGLLTKNPSAMDKDGRNVWSTLNWRKDGLHSLTDMLDWIDLPKISAKIKLPRIGFGRNVEVFDLTRFWAYSNFAHFGNETAWLMAVKERALVASRAHARPLNEREVEGIAKSVGCWVWRRRLDLTQEFRLKQSARGRLGGRPALGQPWTELGISRASYFNKLASGKLTVDGHRTDIERGLGLKPNQIQPVFNVFRFGDFYESI